MMVGFSVVVHGEDIGDDVISFILDYPCGARQRTYFVVRGVSATVRVSTSKSRFAVHDTR